MESALTRDRVVLVLADRVNSGPLFIANASSAPDGRRTSKPCALNGSGAMVFSGCKRTSPLFCRGFGGGFPSRVPVSSLFSDRNPKVVLCGVVGVVLRDFTVGKMGNALSCGSSVASGEGGCCAIGAVAARVIFLWGDFLPLSDGTGDVRPELLIVLLNGNGVLGGGCSSSIGTTFLRALPDVDLVDALVSMVFDRTGGGLADLSVEGAGPIGTRVEDATGPSSARDRGSGSGRAGEDERASRASTVACEVAP